MAFLYCREVRSSALALSAFDRDKPPVYAKLDAMSAPAATRQTACKSDDPTVTRSNRKYRRYAPLADPHSRFMLATEAPMIHKA
jgi:hypothetical protein